MKANYTVEFLSALLSNEVANTDKISLFSRECQQMGIELLPPSVNASNLRFSPSQTKAGKSAIRYGLSAIKHVGEGVCEALIAEREENGEFACLRDLTQRLDTSVLTRRVLESLVRSGALDEFKESRKSMDERLEQLVDSAGSLQRDIKSGQESLFEFDEMVAEKQVERKEESSEEWTKEKRLLDEKELLGIYVTGHPLDDYDDLLKEERYQDLGVLGQLKLGNRGDKDRFCFAGMIQQVEHKLMKTGKRFGVLQIEDLTGNAEMIVWQKSYQPALEAGLLQEGNVITFKAQVQEDSWNDQRRLIGGSELKLLKSRKKSTIDNKQLVVSLSLASHSVEDLKQLKEVLQRHPGEVTVKLAMVSGSGRKALIETGEGFRVKKSANLLTQLAPWIEN